MKDSLQYFQNWKGYEIMPKCILPWISIETTPIGGTRPCCLSTEEIPNINLNKDTLEDAFKSDYMQTMRQEFINGDRPAQCRNCWLEEDAGKRSKRQHMLQKFKHIDVDWNDINGKKLMFLDLKLGNICNLKCRICGAWSSNKWAQEEVATWGNNHIAYKWLKDGKWPRQNPQFWENIDKLLPDIKYFEFTGGEPFLIREHFDLLERAVALDYAKNIDIHYNTNGTQFPKDHILWQEFKQVQIAFSIDNIGERFEYERDGANWNEVNLNIGRITELRYRGYPISTQLCVTWNVQNILYLSDVLEWASNMEFDDIHFNLMHDPIEFSLTNLPLTARQKTLDYLEECTIKYDRYSKEIYSLMQVIESGIGSNGDHLRERLRDIDLIRNKNFLHTHKEMAEAIHYE